MNEQTWAEKGRDEEKPGGRKNLRRRGRPRKQRTVERQRGDSQQKRENPH